MLEKLVVFQLFSKFPVFLWNQRVYFLACNISSLEFIVSQIRKIYIYLSAYLWLYSPLLDLDRFSVSLSFTQLVGHL
jgi:hypothetical protein